MMQGDTPELRRIVRWLEGQFEPGQLARVERVTKNAVRITDRWGDTDLVICRQDGDVEIMPVPEAC
ncbi:MULTISPECIES: hypothetical protein [Clostridia]|uniref:Uncharacterized protein n=1 Tax=Pseudoflavonifractor intestinihominis TaxID=3133171 RepID=A0ABV1E5U1_9FIRM|nr:hypothetical protein [Anaerostipes butyraticus]